MQAYKYAYQPLSNYSQNETKTKTKHFKFSYQN